MHYLHNSDKEFKTPQADRTIKNQLHTFSNDSILFIFHAYFMKGMNLNQSQLAKLIGCTPRKINEIVNGKRGISPEFAIELEEVLGTSAEMWVKMQAEFDLWVARQKVA